jgi:hypothetical protein
MTGQRDNHPNRIDTRRRADKLARARALKASWDGQAFRCHYGGVTLVENDHRSPRYITFDHRTPRQEHDVVIAAACLNDMKSDLSEDEFKAVVGQLARRFTGQPFDETVLNLAHWTR